MHDAKGRELKPGDQILIPMTVRNIFAGEDYCNCDLESVFGRRPDKNKERISSINTGVVLRANPDDENNLEDIFKDK